MRIALAQMKNEGIIQDNLDKSIEFIRQVSKNHAIHILFSQVQLTEFFPQYKGKDVSQYRLKLDSKEVKILQSASRNIILYLFQTFILEKKEKPMMQVY